MWVTFDVTSPFASLVIHLQNDCLTVSAFSSLQFQDSRLNKVCKSRKKFWFTHAAEEGRQGQEERGAGCPT